jgi:hypothetical protein
MAARNVAVYLPGMTEAWDWVRTQHEACPECGFDATVIPDRDLAASIREAGRHWGEWLSVVHDHPFGDDDLASRRTPERWSAIEYAAHVRDVLAIFTNRVAVMRRELNPELEWWDGEATAIEDRYADLFSLAVAADIVHNAAELAAALQPVNGDDWNRGGQRRDASFTLRGVARFVLHELHHHYDDAYDLVLPTVA